jgi:glutaredoxin/glutathione-dependent peroxiredoxin
MVAAGERAHGRIVRENYERGKAMTIKVGDKVPAVKLKQMTPEGMKDVDTGEFFKGKKVVLFALPGAFTPTCSAKHLPGFVEKAAELRSKGVDAVACLSVNDAFVMNAWGKDQKADGKVQMLADGNGDFTRAVGLEMDGSGYGLGKRSQRYAMVVQDGVVKTLNVEKPGSFEVSSVDAVLKAL